MPRIFKRAALKKPRRLTSAQKMRALRARRRAQNLTQISVEIPEQLARQLREFATSRGVTLSKIVAELLAAALAPPA